MPRFRNAAQWWDALGRVPLERILLDPPPGTATPDDVTRLDNHEDRLCELYYGTLVEKTMGYVESGIGMNIGSVLRDFVRSGRLGIVTGADGMIRLLGHQIRIPDVAFVSRERLPGGVVPDKPIPDLVPDLAVEVLSDSNTRREMENKLREYFTAGVRLVWYVDPVQRTIDAFTSPTDIHRLSEADILTGGEVLPGFEVKVAELFELL